MSVKWLKGSSGVIMKDVLNKLKKKFQSRKQPLLTGFFLVLVLISYQNCQTSEDMFVLKKGEYQSPIFIEEGKSSREVSSLEAQAPEENLCANGSTQDLICNPLGGAINKDTDVAAVSKSKLGLIAQLYEGEQNWIKMDLYLKEGYKHQEYIYFSNFNVPSRDFMQGFGFGEADFLKNRHGEKLIEWFAIQAKGNMLLPESEEAGLYHIVTISDDGIRVLVDDKMIINNPTTHSPRIDCADSFVEFKQQEEKPFELTYFQGPRTRIALMAFIKKIDDPASYKKSQYCSTSKGNEPDLLIKEGYKVISPAWFTLPAGF